MPVLPTGTVTFLFTDIEGSTALLQRLGDRRYAEILEEHRRLLRAAFEEGHGQEVDTQGDAFLVAFSRARDAVGAAVEAQRALRRQAWPDGASLMVRMGLHTGEPLSGGSGYVGIDVHRAARVAAAGHGGQILISDVTYGLVARDLPVGVSLRDLGEHRLKDLAHPHRLFQVQAPDLPTNFPAPRSLDAHPHNLPIQLTSFIGREREIAEVKRLLGVARLVTLTGSGGAGKTRLALQVAAYVVEGYPDGVWLAEFAPIADSTLVRKTVASALNVPEQPGRDMMETLVDALQPKTLLLVLDNCEHLLAACRDLAAALLRMCPQLRILATSREGLGVPGETFWRVPSLSVPEDLGHLPPSEELVLYDAVRLFVDRAVATTPGFTITRENAPAVARVCNQLDGIPLAIELAAARVKVLAVEQIAARLDDRFRLLTGGSQIVLPRHQTLRAAIDWSYHLLSEPERVLLRRLSVFAGGCTLEAAESVCASEGIEALSILDLLTSLVDKSLVLAETQLGEARYRLLETVRQYGRDRLQEAGEAATVRQRHRDWHLRFAEQADAKLYTSEQGVWLKRLEAEHDNLRAALEWSKDEKDGASASLRLAGALGWFWYLHGHWSEGRAWLEGALARTNDECSETLPKALLGAGRITWFQGDTEQARPLFERGLALCRELGQKEVMPGFFYWVGRLARGQGDVQRATALLEEGSALCRERADTWWACQLLAERGEIARSRSDYARAAELYLEGLTLSRATGGINNSLLFLHNLGVVALHQDHLEQAAGCYKECLVLCKEVRHRAIAGGCFEGLARVASAQSEYLRAARLFGAVSVLEKSLGQRWHADQSDRDRRAATAQTELGEAAFQEAWDEGRAMTLEQAIEYALAIQ